MSQPSRVRINVVVNLAGSGWLALLALLFPPLFARWMGIESYGLVGFYTSLSGLLIVLDGGLSVAFGREIARLSSRFDDAEAKREMRDLLCTFGRIFGAVAFVLCGAVAAFAPLIARVALNRAGSLNEAEIVGSIRLMAVALGAQFAQAPYAGTLSGLQRQATLNLLQVLTGTLKHGATFGLLYVWRRDAPTYFLCQALGTAFGSAVLRFVAFRTLEGGQARPAFRLELVRRNARYAMGIWSAHLVSIALTQADKFALGKLLPLSNLGYYTLALATGNAPYFLISPLFNAIVPRLTQLHEVGDRAALTALFRKASQAMIALVVSTVVALVSLRNQVLVIYTHGDAKTALIICTTFALRVAATALHGLVYVPYALSLAAGEARVAVWINGALAVCFLPLEAVLIPKYGIEGAALGWLIVTAVEPFAWHAVLWRYGWLDEPFWAGLWRNLLRPSLACVAVGALAHYALPSPHGVFATLASLAVIAALAALATVAASPDLRPILAATLGRAAARLRRSATASS
jgi:O-antigen/teichoic acid export membrane protein